jgi:hypothetical protein
MRVTPVPIAACITGKMSKAAGLSVVLLLNLLLVARCWLA